MDSRKSVFKKSSDNIDNILNSVNNLTETIHLRLKLYFEKEEVKEEELEVEFPMIFDDNSPFAQFVKQYEPNFEEYIILIMALVPHVQIDFYDEIWNQHIPEGNFPKIGGIRDPYSRTFLPTIETAMFVLAGDDLEKRFDIQALFSAEHRLIKDYIIEVEPAKLGYPVASGRFMLTQEYVELFTVGTISKPALSLQFPAQEITTSLEWHDLVLPLKTLTQIEELKDWVQHADTLLKDWAMHRKLKPGYRALFHGPPGTGKTLTASLLGKYTDKDVFRVDLSMVVSKYVGETEKNLNRLFDKATGKDWILFFDEADALFGKRTEINDANDRHANRVVSFLLQRVEMYPGLVILTSNLKSNMDEAFLRRFNAVIHFPFPSKEHREQIWAKSFPEHVRFDQENFSRTLSRYELSGGSIINVVQFACLKAIARDTDMILLEDALLGIKREYEKEERVFKANH